IVGVNTFRDPKGSPTVIPDEVIRSTTEEKDYAVDSVHAFEARNESRTPEQLQALQSSAIGGGNVFDTLLEASKVASLGQLSAALYSVGGQYRRNM
ncbi:MAG: methylmalonyl-CoA mutase family protein, partial [Planctomycetota bacterium]|nr:methylmalonyl-CoA mutase family protein [Planctomycetota bacterium]